MSHDVKAARKTLLSWQLPMLISGIAISFWGTFYNLVPTVNGFITSASVIRIYAGAVLFPLCNVLTVVLFASVILRAIPASAAVFNYFGRVVNYLVLWGCVPLLLFVLLVARPLQQHYMPKLGYSECGLLHGNPTLWFTDWVKDPVWCVKGKDHEWVFEQAKLAEEKSAKPERAVMPAQTKQ